LAQDPPTEAHAEERGRFRILFARRGGGAATATSWLISYFRHGVTKGGRPWVDNGRWCGFLECAQGTPNSPAIFLAALQGVDDRSPMIEIFFDFVSPYAYLGCSKIEALGAKLGHVVEPKPVLFAAILNARGTKGPAEVPARRAYVVKDVLRAAARAGVPVDLPPAHPFNPLPALRAAAIDVDGAQRWAIIHALFAATWRNGKGVDGPEHVAAALRAAGLDADSILAMSNTPETKERLRRNTDDALARGAFGVPTMFIEGEMFFGFDSFPAIETFVRGDDPAAKRRDLVERWATLPAAAVRPQSR
jgi:2-hydroxychromene-2-carboxylate isomerase